MNDLRGFIADNREGVGVTVDHLTAITTALNDSRGDVKQILHITPTVFQNFMNIYQPAQSAVTGILAPVNFANTVQFICSAIQAASRRGYETVREAVRAVPGADHQEPPVQLLPVRASTRSSERRRGPNEITYSEDRLNPHLPPATPADVPAARRPAPAACGGAADRDIHRRQSGSGRPDGRARKPTRAGAATARGTP